MIASIARTNTAVEQETAELLADEERKEGNSLTALTNEAIGSALRVCKYGGTPREVYPSWRWSRILKDTDAIPLPGDLMEELIKRFYALDEDWPLKRWFDEGRRIGSYLHMFADDFNLLASRID